MLKKRGFTLLEVVIAAILSSIVFSSIFIIDLFARSHISSSNQRSIVQNELSNAIETMSKYVQQSIGDINNPAITAYPSLVAQTGFQVRVDFNSPQTPKNLSDDSTMSFSLTNNQLTAACVNSPTGAGCPFVSEILSDKVVSNFTNIVMPDYPVGNGFYVSISNSGSTVDIGLVGRYKPTQASSIENPEVSMRTSINSGSSSYK